MNLTNKQSAWAFLIIGAIVLVGLVILGLTHHNKTLAPTSAPGTYDSNSGQTVGNQNGQVPENNGATSNPPIYLGMSNLLQFGVTQTQLTSLETAFVQYAHVSNQKLAQVSVGVQSISPAPLSPTSPTQSIYFNVVLNSNTTYYARLDCLNLSQIELFLYNPKTNAQIFDSGTTGSAS